MNREPKPSETTRMPSLQPLGQIRSLTRKMTASPDLPRNELTTAHKGHKGHPGPSVAMHKSPSPWWSIWTGSILSQSVRYSPRPSAVWQGGLYPFSSAFENQGMFTQITERLLGSGWVHRTRSVHLYSGLSKSLKGWINSEWRQCQMQSICWNRSEGMQASDKGWVPGNL